MFGWDDAVAGVAKTAASIADYFNKKLGRQIKLEDQDTGRNLQVKDNLQESVKSDVRAQENAEAVHDLGDDALNAELRDGPPGTARPDAGRK